MKLGNTTISSIFKGNTEISKIYKGTLVVYEAFRELIANGVPPITLTNCIGKNVISYKIYGNSVQNVKISNLYDGTYTSGQYYNADGILTNNSAVSMSSMYEISYSKYECYFDATQAAVVRINFFDSANNWIGQEILDDTLAVKEGIFNVPLGAKYLNFSILTTYIELEHFIQPSIDAEPTYDYPIEVESVGERTINLANIDTGLDSQLTKNEDGTYKLEYNYEHISGDIAVNLEAGKTYTVSAEIIESTASYTATNGKQYCLPLFSNKAGETSEYYSALPAPSEPNQRVSATITPKNNHAAIKMYINKSYVDVGGYVIFKDFQIKEGTEDADYEPYGYKVPVESTSTLYDFTLDKIEQLAYNETGALRYGFDLGILEAGQHTLDLEYDTFPSYLYLRWKDIEGNFSTLYITTDKNTSKLPLTFNADGTSNYYVFFASTSISTLQKAKSLWNTVKFACLQKGETIKHNVANIFLNEPLRKIDYHTDYIDYENKKVIRHIHNENITSPFVKSSLIGAYALFLSKVAYRPYMDGTRGYAISNNFISYTGSYSQIVNFGGYIQGYRTESGVDTVAYTFNDVNIQTLDQVKAKISSGFNVSYALVTPIEEEINIPDILLEEGTNIIKTNTKTTPSNIQVVYKGK